MIKAATFIDVPKPCSGEPLKPHRAQRVKKNCLRENDVSNVDTRAHLLWHLRSSNLHALAALTLKPASLTAVSYHTPKTTTPWTKQSFQTRCLVEYLSVGNLFAFLLTARISCRAACRQHAANAMERVRQGLESAMRHGVNLPLFDRAVRPAVALDLWLVDNPLRKFGELWEINMARPGQIGQFLAASPDPISENEFWEVFNAGEASWPSARYLQKHIAKIAWLPDVNARPVDALLRAAF